MPRLLLIALALLLGCSAAEPRTAADDIVIANITLIDGRGGPAVPNAAVVVRNGRVADVLTGDRRPPATAERIDGKGGFLLPGFIDMHAHLLVPRCRWRSEQGSPFDRGLSERMMSALLDFGVTTVRSPATPTVEGLRLRDDLNAGRVRGPRAFASAEFINDPRLTEDALRRYVREAMAFRPDYFKVYARLRPDQVAVVIDEAHRHGVPVIGHLQATSWREGVERGIDHLTHAADWSAETLPAADREAYAAAIRERGSMRARLDWLERLDPDSPEVREMIAAVARRGVSIDPTLVAFDSKFSGPDGVRYTRNRYLDAVPELVADWNACGAGVSDWTDADHRRWRTLFPKLQGLVKRMHDGGVLLTTGSDVTNPWVIPGESLHQEFELLVEAGLTPAQVLQMTGENAARALGRDDIGVVEAGRRADLVLLSANPLDRIGNTRQIVWVMQGGRRISQGPPQP